MHKVLISIPENLVDRFRAVVPARQRSKVISTLIAGEINKRENDLYACALAVETDNALKKEMRLWDITTGDGLEDLQDESW
jgi:hypothetical protein